jgi:ankyrin repeat protein
MASSSKENNFLQLLPTELFMQIVSYLDPPDLNALLQTNSSLFHALNGHLYHLNVLYDNASAVWWAAQHGVESTLHRLVATGANFRWDSNFWHCTSHIRTRWVFTRRNRSDVHNWQAWDHPIAHAARHGHIRFVDRLLALGVNINYKDPHGHSPLALAAHGGHFTLVRFLVSRGAFQLSVSRWGERPISLAAAEGHHEIEDFLLQELRRFNYLDLTIKEAIRAMLNCAVQRRDAARIRHMISKEADVNFRLNSISATPLYLAVKFDCPDVVRLLLENGASPNVEIIRQVRNQYFPFAYCSPLDICLGTSHSLELLHLLLQNGANVAKYGEKALYVALKHSKIAEFQVLVDSAVDVATNFRVLGRPLLSYAITWGRCQFVEILLEKGALIDPRDLRRIRRRGRFNDEALLCYVESLIQ